MVQQSKATTKRTPSESFRSRCFNKVPCKRWFNKAKQLRPIEILRSPFEVELSQRPLLVCVCVCAGDVHVCICVCVCVRLRVCWRICVKGHIMSNITSYVWSYWDLNVQSLHCKRLSIMWNRLFDQPRHYVTVIEHRWRLTRHDDHRSLKLNGSLNVNNVVPQFILIHCTWI